MSDEEELSGAFCPYCGGTILFRWANGVVPSPDYVLIADWLYHTVCWDKLAAERPPK